MTTYRVYEIQWDTDGKSVPGLPVEVVVDLDDAPEDDDDGVVLGKVSDEFGWLIANCKIEQVA